MAKFWKFGDIFYQEFLNHTGCPGRSDPPEKIFNIFASENEVYTIFFNYYDTLGWILFVYRAK